METSKSASTANATTVYFQLICIAITSIAIGLIFLKTLGTFRSADEKPQIFPLLPKDIVAFGGTPTTVKVGLGISSFSVFNILANEFEYAGTLWFEFDPNLTSLNSVRQFSFEKSEVVSLSEPTTKIIGDKLFASYDIRMKKKENLNYSFFPFSSHTFNVVIDHRTSPGELVFEAALSDLVISAGAIPSGWAVTDKSVYTGFSATEFSSINQKKALYHSRVIFSLDFALKSLRNLLTILLPLILMFFISMFSFSMDPTIYYRSIIALSTGTLTAMLAYRFVIENLAPKVGYFMISDAFFFLFFSACCVIFLINTKTLELSRHAKYIFTVLIHLGIILGMFILLHWWR